MILNFHFPQEMSEALRGGGAAVGGGHVGKPVKVVLCQQYTKDGHCERGASCQFAHGLQELHIYRAKQVC